MSSPRYAVRVELSDGSTFTRELGAERIRLGRGDDCELVLADVGVSREHAVLSRTPSGVELEDLGSTNGTRINGETVRGRQMLHDGDELLVGRALLSFQVDATQSVSLGPARPLRDSDTLVKQLHTPEPAATLGVSDSDQQRIEGENRGLRLLHQLAGALEPELSAASLCRRVLRVAVRALDAERGVVMLGERAAAVVDSGSAAFDVNPAVLERARAVGMALLTLSEGRSVLCIPLGRGERTHGVIYLDAPVESRRFAARDLDWLGVVARHLATLLDNAALVEQLRRAQVLLAAENRELKQSLGERRSGGLLGDSEPMRALQRTLGKLAANDVTVLITGESGTGKELVARTIHQESARRDAPFIAIHCAAIPENLLEAELFGIEKGVATGVDRRPGKFEQAGDGTVFLDEVGEVPLAIQAKLLRVLQEREVERVGGRSPVPVRARILAATNRDLRAEVAAGRFREDLFYRLEVVPLKLPPLRERPVDIAPLAERFLDEAARRQHKSCGGFSEQALRYLETYAWPGNVRELQNELERVVSLWEPGPGPRSIVADDLSDRIRATPEKSDRYVDEVGLGDIKEVVGRLVERAESHLIRRALAETSGNKAAAADLLGLTREGLRKKMLRYAM